VQVAQDSEALEQEQRRGVLATVVLLWTALSLALRSWRLGLLGLIPNVLPCLVLQGSLALADRPLSVATAMIATVLLGLIVDDTIHFLHGYRAERRAGCSVSSALERALEHSGRAIVVTSAVLAAGFAAGLVGRLTTTIEFAALCSLTILLALACDLVLLPALLLLPERRLGRRPQNEPREVSAT
jgi:predicted RND superfamily exporter protein